MVLQRSDSRCHCWARPRLDVGVSDVVVTFGEDGSVLFSSAVLEAMLGPETQTGRLKRTRAEHTASRESPEDRHGASKHGD